MSDALLVVGSVAFDSVQSRAGSRDELLGGAATYIGLAASHFCPVQLVAVVGENDFPQQYETLLSSRGVDLAGLETAPGRTFRWAGRYADDFSTRETLDTQLGVFADFAPKIPAAFRDAKMLLLGNINPSVQRDVLDAVSPDCFVITDTMNLWIEIALAELKAVIARTSLRVINDEEALLLTGEPQVAVAAQKIRAMGPSWVIIKRGEHGAWLFGDEGIFLAPPLPLEEVVDPTGAGDSFAGGLAGFLCQSGAPSWPAVKQGMLYGTAIASGTCEAFGTEKTASLTRDDIDARYRRLRQLVSLDD